MFVLLPLSIRATVHVITTAVFAALPDYYSSFLLPNRQQNTQLQ